MDKNTVIGFLLIFVLLIGWQYFMAPSQEEIAHQKYVQDSILMVQHRADSIASIQSQKSKEDVIPQKEEEIVKNDSLQDLRLQIAFGDFAASAKGEEKTEILENDLFRITFSNKGGRITEVWLKEYFKAFWDSAHIEQKIPLLLLEDEKNKFEYLLPVKSSNTGTVKTSDLYFSSNISGSSITFRADAGNGKYFEQTYSIKDGSYNIDYEVKFSGLTNTFGGNVEEVKLFWLDYLDKIERATTYEIPYATAYFKAVDENVNYCKARKDDTQDAEGAKLEWVSFTNQFFNATLMAPNQFNSGVMRGMQVDDKESDDLRAVSAMLNIPTSGDDSFEMDFYIGPNEFDRLRAYGNEAEEVVYFGWSIFGTINRWMIRPLFNFLARFIGSYGIVILLLTFFVKLLLYPLNYKYIYSQAKTQALKPQIEKLKEKMKDDKQALQVETMSLYRKYGVNPMGGCLPMALQMPVWFALYRFFPAAIDFRQSGFLWATDLSSYDVAFFLPFEIPAYGGHVSLFTLLWAAGTIVYAWYNSKQMDMSSMNPSMKYVQYFMPIMFLVFFNNYASGLTLYLFLSNLMTIAQTVITKRYFIDHDKIAAELEAHRKKPKKKKGKFAQKFQDALAEQQRIQAERDNQKNKPRRKK